jgi:hypothetical protein
MTQSKNQARQAQRDGRFLERGQKQTTDGNLTIMVHAFSREAHNLLSVRNMHYSNQISTTQQTQDTETGYAWLEPGHTMMWLLGASTISYYQEMAAEEPMTWSGPHESAERLSFNTFLPHPLRSSITALRSFFGMAMLSASCAWLMTSLVYAAELFPFPSQSSTQQRSVERQPAGKAQLSTDDEKRVSMIATQAKQLSPSDRSELKSSIQKSLNEAAAKRNLNQVKYFSELLRQIE